MARITIEDCLGRVSSRFELVHLAAQRVRQIREGSEYLVSSPKNEDIVVALREIAAGKITKDNINTPVNNLFDSNMRKHAEENEIADKESLAEDFEGEAEDEVEDLPAETDPDLEVSDAADELADDTEDDPEESTDPDDQD